MVIEIQDAIQKYIESKSYIVWQVVYTELKGGLLSISFPDSEEYMKFLKGEGFYGMCDKSGVTEYPKTNVLILTGTALYNYLRDASESTV